MNSKKTEDLFFEILQVAVGNRESLSVGISDADWLRLFEFCKKQALIGVGFTAVEKLHVLGVECPANLRMQWMALALQIEKRNALLNEQCRQLTERYKHDGFVTCILKGQGNCINYPENLRRRQCGDIDVWATPINVRQQEQLETTICPRADRGGERELPQITRELNEIGPQADDGGEQQLSSNELQLKEKCFCPQMSQMDTDGCPQADGGIAIAVQTGREEVEYVEYHGRKAVIEYVKMQHRLAGDNIMPKQNYHHIDAPTMDGTEVEVHFRAAHLYSPLRNWRLQKWMNEHADECMKNKTHLGFAMPTSSVNVIYQMTHMFKHHIDGGLGFRHLMDYYYALRVWHNDVMECKDLQSQGMWCEGLGTHVMSNEEVMSVIRSFGMTKFTAAVMYVLHKVFDMSSRHSINDKRLLITDWPWMICEPNEKEGKKLLAEIMNSGNFGHYDSEKPNVYQHRFQYHIWKFKRIFRLAMSYPEEALWEPVFRGWRKVMKLLHI